MTNKEIQDAADQHKEVEIKKAININNSIHKAIEDNKRGAIVQAQSFDLPDYDFEYYDEEGTTGHLRKY